jgi:signal transduction histidine kinase
MRRIPACLLFSLILAVGAGSRELQAEEAQAPSAQLGSLLRKGETEVAWRHFLDLQEAIEAHPEDEQRAIFYRGAQIAMLSGYQVLAHEILNYSRIHSSGFDDQNEERSLGIGIQVFIALGWVNEAGVLVDTLIDQANPFTGGGKLANAFLYKGVIAWLSGDASGAIKFMEEVLEMESDVRAPLRDAVADLIIALVLDERGEEDMLVSEQLGIARAGFHSSGASFAFGPMLVGLVELHYVGDYSRLSKAVLDALSSLSKDEGEWIRATGFAAMGELYHREGDFQMAEEMRAQSRVWQLKSIAEMQTAHREWEKLSGKAHAQAWDSTRAYLLILALLLILLVLVLVLRMRTQWMINDRLRASIESSRLAEEAAARSARLRKQFVSNVSHEIKTPMSGLVGMASILDELITDPEHRKYVETIQTCSKNLLVILDDLLDLGRMESGRLDIESEPFRLADTFLYCEQVTGLEARRKGLNLKVEIDPDVPEVIYGDSTRLQQILVNLLNNAIKFTEKGSVTMRAQFESIMPGTGTLRISVSDTGRGMPEELIPTVFEPFNQRQQEVDTASGNGLGLAISQKLADLMGGVISVESVVNKGSTFMLSLPIDAESSNSFA